MTGLPVCACASHLNRLTGHSAGSLCVVRASNCCLRVAGLRYVSTRRHILQPVAVVMRQRYRFSCVSDQTTILAHPSPGRRNGVAPKPLDLLWARHRTLTLIARHKRNQRSPMTTQLQLRSGHEATLASMIALIGVFVLPVGTAAVISDKAAFIATVGTIPFESFEGLPTDNAASPGHVQVLGPDFAVSNASGAGARLSVWDVVTSPSIGHASDGVKYLFNAGSVGSAPNELRLVFNHAINVIGFSITDFGDSEPATITYEDNAGAALVIADVSSALPDDNEFFFGFVSDQSFSEVVLRNTSLVDGWSLDEVWYRQAIPEPRTNVAVALLLCACGMGRRVWISRRHDAGFPRCSCLRR